MKVITGIDRLKLGAEFLDDYKQREVMSELTYSLQSTYDVYITSNAKYPLNNLYTHEVYTAGTKILELKSGSYLGMDYNKNKKRVPIYYITIEFAGLKRYDEKIDAISLACLKRVCAYLNSNSIGFFYTGMDICVDMFIPFNLTYAFCNSKSPMVRYYKVDEKQPYRTTHYIEKYNHTHNQVMKRAYLYDKRVKENNIDFNITRFELKLQSKFFNIHDYKGTILDKYHILCFETQQEKNLALSLYKDYEDVIRRRDLHKLGLDDFRVYPDVKQINKFLFSLYEIYESDLITPPNKKSDNDLFKELGFD